MALDPHEIRRLRADVPALQNQIYVNWGGGGASSESTFGEMEKFLRRELVLGPFHPKARDEARAALESARESCAKLLGARPAEIALVNNTTAGVNIAAAGIEWRPEDEVVLTDLEHPGGYLPWLVWRGRSGVKVKISRTGEDDRALLQNLENAVSQKTRAVCVSHVSWLTGRKLPLKAISEICARSDALLVVDGAQSVGHIPVKIEETGADVYTISGQKWLMGPSGTGAVYVRCGAGKDIHLASAGYRSAQKKRLETLSFTPQPDAVRYEIGTLHTPAFLGLRVAIDHFRKTGPASIEKRILGLANRLLSQIRAMRNVVVITPPGEAQSGLVSFRIQGVESQGAVDALGEQNRIILRAVATEPPAIRVSIHYLNTEKEMDAIASAVSAIASGAKNRQQKTT